MFGHELATGVLFAPLEPWHAAELAANVDRGRAEFAPWIPLAVRVVDVDSARVWLREHAQRQARDTGRACGIWCDGTLVGGTVFRTFDAGTGVCEIGVWLEPVAQGQGLVTAAVRYMIDWAVRVRGMSRIEWRTDPANTRSRAVAVRLGMQLDGVLRSAFAVDGVRHDSEVWSMLAEHWPGTP